MYVNIECRAWYHSYLGLIEVMIGTQAHCCTLTRVCCEGLSIRATRAVGLVVTNSKSHSIFSCNCRINIQVMYRKANSKTVFAKHYKCLFVKCLFNNILYFYQNITISNSERDTTAHQLVITLSLWDKI